MAKLSQQLKRTPTTRPTRTERKIKVQQARPQQEPLPKGSLVKADVLKKLLEAREKEKQISLDRAEAFKQLQVSQGGQNIGKSQLRDFHNAWNRKRELQKVKVRVLNNLNSQMTTNSFISKTKLEGTLSSASSQTSSTFELSERRVREKQKVQEPTGVIDTTDFLKGLEETSTREVRRVEGGFSEVSILEGNGRKVQVVRSKDTGEVRIVELEGAKKGQVFTGRSLTDAEIQSTQLAELKQRKADRDPFLDIDQLTDATQSASGLRKFSAFVLTSPERALSFTFNKVKGIKIPISTGGAGTGFIKLKDLTSDPELNKVIKSVSSKAVTGVSNVLKSTGDIFAIPVFTGGSGSIDLQLTPTVKESKQSLDKRLAETSSNLLIGDLKARGISETFNPIFEAEYSARFEDKFGEKIIKGEITFEEAQKQFATSDEAKLVAKRFGQVIEKKRAGSFTFRAGGIAGISLARLGIKIIPETKGGLLLESSVIGGSLAGIGALPSGVTKLLSSKTLLTGFGLHGVGKAIDPKSSPEDIAQGIAMASLSFGILAIRGIKFLKTPTIKTKVIDAPRITVKADAQIIKEAQRFNVTKNGKVIPVEKLTFPRQRITQVGVAGRRTIVSTKFRDLLRLDPISQGVPSSSRGTTLTLKSIRGDFVFKTLSDRQKAFNLLLKSDRAFLTVGDTTKLISLKGASASQLNAILRFTAPKVITQTIESGTIIAGQKQAIGRISVITEQPVLIVDEGLGIKTRGARPIRDIFDINRKLLKDVKVFADKNVKVGFVTENVRKTTMFVTKQGASFNTLKQAGKTETFTVRRSLVHADDVTESFNKVAVRIGSEDTFLELSKKIPFKIQDVSGVFTSKQLLPSQKGFVRGEGKATLLKRSPDQKIIDISLDKIDDLVLPQRTGTFGGTAQQEIQRILKRQGINNAIKLRQEVKPFKFDLADDFVPTTNLPVQQQFAPTRQVFDIVQPKPIPLLKIDPALKTGINPVLDIKINIKNLLKINRAIAEPSLVGVELTSALKLSQLIKQDLKTDLKFDVDLKTNLKTNQAIKQLIKQAQAQRSGQAFKQLQALKLSPSLIAPTTPVFRTPTFPDFKPPVIPIIPFYFAIPKGKKKKTAREKNLIQQLAFLPDFTSRALGLDPIELTESQALKNIKKIRTGFEIRRSVKLLKGIPE